MENEQNNQFKKEINELLSEVFLKDDTNENIQVIKKADKIPSILSFLYSKDKPITAKYKCLTMLLSSFKLFPFNLDIFTRYKSEDGNMNIFTLLINIYLETDPEQCDENTKNVVLNYQKVIMDILNEFVSHVTCPVEVYEFVYKYINKYSSKSKGENDPVLSKELFTRFLDVMRCLYGLNANENNPCNYFYFSGEGDIKINNNIGNGLNLNSVINIGLWFNISKKSNSELLNIELTNGNTFDFLIDSDNQLSSSFSDNKSIYSLKQNQWYIVIFKIYYISNNFYIEIYVNGEKCNFIIHKEISNSGIKIKTVSLFKNFVGKCSSILLSTGKNSEIYQFPYGIYTEELYQQFAVKDIKTRFNRVKDQVVIQDPNAKNILLTNPNETIDIKDNLVEQWISIYMPTRIERENNKIILKDAISDLNAEFESPNENSNGVLVYKPMFKNVNYIGGVSAFLPIAEMFTKLDQYEGYINKDILTQENFNSYIWIIATVLSGQNYYNLQNAMSSKFFFCLSLFLEKIPSELFTNEVIGLFKTTSSSLINDSTFKALSQEYHRYILLNEDILFKYSFDLLTEVWKHINTVYISKQFADIIDELQMASILLRYDKDHDTIFCCEEHTLYFLNHKEMPVLKPELKTQLAPLRQIFDILMNRKQNGDEKLLTLYQLLTMELSPCLQLMIIESFEKYYIAYQRKSAAARSNNVMFSPKVINEIIKINLFVLSIALYDVRCEVINFIFLLVSFEKENSDKLLTQDQQTFIINNLTPINVMIEKEGECTAQIDDKNSSSAYLGGKQYTKLIVPLNKERISKYYDPEYFSIISAKVSLILIYFLENSIMVPFTINLLVKLCINSDIKVAFSFLNKIYEAIESELKNGTLAVNQKKKIAKAIINNTNFLKWILDFAFQIFLFIKNPNYKPGFILLDETKEIDGEEKKDDSKKKRSKREEISDNFQKVKQIIEYICCSNILQLDYLLTWGQYYNILYEQDRDYYNQVREFIKEIIKTISEKTITHLPLEKLNIDSPYWISFLYCYSITFEFETIYKTNNPLEDQTDLSDNKKNIYIPYYFKPEYFKDDNQTKATFESLGFLLNASNEIWKKEQFKQTTDEEKLNYYCLVNKDNQFDVFLEQIQLLTFTQYIDDKKIMKNNKGIPLMKLISNTFTLIIATCDDIQELESTVEQYHDFLLFIIISTTNMKYNEKEKKKYEEIHLLAKNTIFFGMCFLIQQIFERKTNNAFFFKALKSLLSICFKIYYHVQNIIFEKQKEGKGLLSFNWFKSKSGNDLSNCAVYLLFKECFEINGHFISLDKDNKEKKFDKSSQMALYEKGDKDVKLLFESQTFKGCFTENKKLKNNVEHFMFSFKQIFELRKKKVSELIPSYDNEEIIKKNNINYKENTNQIVINSNYEPITKFQELLKNEMYDNNQKFSTRIDVYNITKEFMHHRMIKKYKIIKKDLFSFRHIWSKEELFYTEGHLKHKLVNHYSTEFSKVLMTPILDIHSYLPEFSGFDPKDLFYKDKEDEAAKLPLAADLNFINEEEQSNQMINNDNKEKNILHKIYKEYFNYHDSNLQKIKKKTKEDKFKEFIKSRMITISPEYETIVECCILKQSCHIKGYFFNDGNSIGFYAYDLDISKNFEEFDKDRKTCYGSIFKAQVKKMKHYFIKIQYKQIEMLLKRRYFFRRNAIEIFTILKKSYFFKFKTDKDCMRIVENIKKHLNYDTIYVDYNGIDKKVGISNKKCILLKSNMQTSHLSLSDKYKKWKNWEISTLELIMYLNLYGNRSYCDLMQYPVAPWPFEDYSSQTFSIDKTKIRPFDLPMGMMENTPESISRKNAYKAHYDSMVEEEEPHPYYYGSHYSNSLYTTHYLVRVFPFSYIKIELQGKNFDDPNRLFNDMGKSYQCSVTQKCDVRELIPEFFFFPEMFYNRNDLNLGEVKVDDVYVRVNDVQMPPWSDNDGYNFIKDYRKILESEECSETIHQWFELIFGKNQKRENNMFYGESYESFEEESFNQSDPEQQTYSLRMLEFGVTPNQILDSWSLISKPERKKYSDLGHNEQITSLKNLSLEIAKSNIENEPVYIKISDSSKKAIITVSKNQICIYPIVKKSTPKQNPDANQYELGSFHVINITFVSHRMHSEITNLPMVIYNESNLIAIGGYWNGQIIVRSLKEKSQDPIRVYQKSDMSPVVKIAIDKNENFVITGTISGNVHIFNIDDNDPTLWRDHIDLYDHRSEITDIAINSVQNVFITISKDSYANIYTLPDCKLINSLKLNSPSSKCLIASSPLPCIIFYFNNEKKIDVYSINGHFIISKNLSSEIVQWKIFTNYLFADYLMYTCKDYQKITIASLPELTEVTIPSTEHTITDFDVSEDKSYAVLLETFTDGEKRKANIYFLKDSNLKI